MAVSAGTFYGQAMTAGDIYAVAGTGQGGSAGDTHEASRARLSAPADVIIDPAGDLVITDTGNTGCGVVTH